MSGPMHDPRTYAPFEIWVKGVISIGTHGRITPPKSANTRSLSSHSPTPFIAKTTLQIGNNLRTPNVKTP